MPSIEVKNALGLNVTLSVKSGLKSQNLIMR